MYGPYADMKGYNISTKYTVVSIYTVILRANTDTRTAKRHSCKADRGMTVSLNTERYPIKQRR